jgi:hypothetical protein
MGTSPEELYKEREKRVNDAIQLKVPDRVPFFPGTHLYAAKYTGMTLEEAYYNADKWYAANKKMNIDLEPDLYFPGSFAIFTSGAAFEAVDCKQIKWPGHGVPPNSSYQFVEGEYMKVDEYDAFLDDPSDYALRTYMPRVYGTLEPLKMLPPIKSMLLGYAGLAATALLVIPAVATAFNSLYRAGLEAAKWAAAGVKFDKEMAELGFPPLAQGVALAPFDMLGDMMRGTKGIMLDMYRQPDKLLQATEKVLPMIIEVGVAGARMGGSSRIFIALHKGSDGFMSLKQFETFYWPGLKKLILALIDAGLTPCVFFEGSWTERLEYLNELPKGKILGLFQSTDIFKAKEILKNTMCIAGNMPPSLLQAGTPQQVKDYTKKLIDIVGKGGGFIMSCSGVMDEADPKLVRVWKDFTKEYGVYQS